MIAASEIHAACCLAGSTDVPQPGATPAGGAGAYDPPIVEPRHRPVQANVAGHYDVLDDAYRRTWGEHVHHGLWTTGSETPDEATRQLTRRVADAAGVAAGQRVVDVGCGYGATSRLLARERGAAMTGLTLSAAQATAYPPVPGVELLVRDWLDNALPDAAFDAAISIEAISHMPDKPRAFAELARVVKPGGRVALVDWLTREGPSPREVRWLLRPICEEGHLPSLHAPSEYAAYLREAGFEVGGYEDLSERATRTWAIVARRLPGVLARDPRLFARLLRSPDRVFALSLARIPLAYRVGAMRLGLFSARRK